MFVSVEGIDQAGKTTQIQMLSEELARQGLRVNVSKSFQFFCGKWLIGFSRMIMGRKSGTWFTDLLFFWVTLFQSAQIRYRLRRFHVVIADRWTGPFLAYHHGVKKCGEGVLESTEVLCSLGIKPDLVILIDISAREARERLLDSRPLFYHRLMRSQYRELANKRGWGVVKGNRDRAAVHKEILCKIKEVMERQNK